MKLPVKDYMQNLAKLFKTALFAVLIGFFTGLLSVFFVYVVKKINMNSRIGEFYYFLPAFLFLSSFLIYHIEPSAMGSGTEKVISSIKENNGNINVKVIPVKILSTLITIIGGGSIGKVGPSAQIGAAFASSISRALNFTDDERRKFLICGISAGFSSILGAPISSALFAVEVLVLDRIFYELLFLSMISSITAFNVSSHFNIVSYNRFLVINTRGFSLDILHSLFFGLVSGLVGLSFILLLKLLDLAFSKMNIYTPLKAIIGGLVLVTMIRLTSVEYLGFGLETIRQNVLGLKTEPLGFVFKALATGLTLSSGGSGGLITPIFFIGSSVGNSYAQFFNLNISAMSSIGILTLLASTTNAPIASCILGLELFGKDFYNYAPIAIMTSFIIASQGSLYIHDSLSAKSSSSLPSSDFHLHDDN